MNCSECKRLIALHLRAIAEWKEALRANFIPEESPKAVIAWERALEAERAINEHREQSGCETHTFLQAVHS